MSHQVDSDFVDQLRGMAATTPVIAVPGAETIIRAGRHRMAQRRSAYAGAFGVVLLGSAGLSTMLPGFGGVAVTEQLTAPVAHFEAPAPAVGAPESVLAPNSRGAEAGATAAEPLESLAYDGVAPLDTQLVQPTDLPVLEDANLDSAGLDSARLEDESIEATGATIAPTHQLSPLATGLGIAGVAALGTAAGLALQARRLTPALAKARAN